MPTDPIPRHSNPFTDRPSESSDRMETLESLAESTLAVSRNASLTLGVDSLIVLDEGFREHRHKRKFCGLIPVRSTNTRTIPYFSVLWAEASESEVAVHFAKATSKSPQSSVSAVCLTYALEQSPESHAAATRWVNRLLDRAYSGSQRCKRLKILLNPYGGAGQAKKLYHQHAEPLFIAANCFVDVETTKYSGHAAEISEKLDIDAYDVLVSASGDGLPHECFNGLSRKSNASEALRKVAVTQLPCGTGNAMSWNLNGTGNVSLAALRIIKGVRTPLDLVSVTQGDKRTMSFLSQTVGIIAESDLGTDNIRWMGDTRFVFGFLMRLWGKTLYPVDIAVKTEIDDKKEIKEHYGREIARRGTRFSITPEGPLDLTKGLGLPPLKYGTVNDPVPTGAGWSPLTSYDNLGNFYCGNMAIMAEDTPFFPASLPSDGMCDLVTIDGDVSRTSALGMLISVPKGTFFENPDVRFRKISALRVVPKYGRWADEKDKPTRVNSMLRALGLIDTSEEGGFFAVDGEKLPFAPFQLEVHRGLGMTLSRRGNAFETPGPHGWDNLLGDLSGSTTRNSSSHDADHTKEEAQGLEDVEAHPR